VGWQSNSTAMRESTHEWLSAFSASTPNPLPWASMPAVLSIEPPSEGIVARSVKSTSCGSTR
jgi:hypothetical protein